MIFKVKEFEYEFKNATQSITKDICSFNITLADNDVDIEEMDNNIRSIIPEGFFLEEKEYFGYELQVITRNIIGEDIITSVQLFKDKTK